MEEKIMQNSDYFKKKKELITPFDFEKPKELIMPFVIDNLENMEEEPANQNPEGIQTSYSLGNAIPASILPFEFISKDDKQVAKNICSPLQATLGDVAESLVPYIGMALKNYKKAGYQIPPMFPETCQKFKKSKFNFELTLDRKVIQIVDTANGEKGELLYHINIKLYLRNGESCHYTAKIKSDKIKNCLWLNHATNSLAKLPNDKDEKIEFERIIQECIESQNVPIELIYPNAGWRLIENLGWRYVYATGAIGVEGEFIHTKKCDEKFMFPTTSLTPYEIFNNAMNMRKICKNRFASTILLLFTHVSTMTTFFEERGFPINFILGIVGVTNSRKTSLAMEFTKIFSEKKKMADAEFTATDAGIEKTLSKYKDAPILIDDFHPGETRSEQLELNKKLQKLVRYYGNRIPKKGWMTTLEKRKSFFQFKAYVCLLWSLLRESSHLLVE